MADEARNSMNDALVAALRAERFDPARRDVTICGVRYSIALFEHLGLGEVGEWLRIEKREGETLTLRRASGPDWPTEREEVLSVLRELADAVRADSRRRGAMTPEVLVALDAADAYLR
jgi:hypothetical protein